MVGRLYPVPCPDAAGRLALSACPPGGRRLASTLAAWAEGGIDDVVSLLTAAEAAALGVEGEAAACRACGLGFRAFPVPDFGVPSDAQAFTRLARWAAGRIGAGGGVAIHCRGGIGRSGTLAAAVLILRGHPPGEAVDAVSAARGVPSPETARQRAWLRDWGLTLSIV